MYGFHKSSSYFNSCELQSPCRGLWQGPWLCQSFQHWSGITQGELHPGRATWSAGPAGEQHSTPQEVSTSGKEEKDERWIYRNSSQKESQAGLKGALAQTLRGQGGGRHTPGACNLNPTRWSGSFHPQGFGTHRSGSVWNLFSPDESPGGHRGKVKGWSRWTFSFPDPAPSPPTLRTGPLIRGHWLNPALVSRRGEGRILRGPVCVAGSLHHFTEQECLYDDAAGEKCRQLTQRVRLAS